MTLALSPLTVDFTVDKCLLKKNQQKKNKHGAETKTVCLAVSLLSMTTILDWIDKNWFFFSRNALKHFWYYRAHNNGQKKCIFQLRIELIYRLISQCCGLFGGLLILIGGEFCESRQQICFWFSLILKYQQKPANYSWKRNVLPESCSTLQQSSKSTFYKL